METCAAMTWRASVQRIDARGRSTACVREEIATACAHLHLGEYVVLCLGFARDLDLLQTHGDRVARLVYARNEAVKAVVQMLCIFAAALHNLRRSHPSEDERCGGRRRGVGAALVLAARNTTLTVPVSTVVQHTQPGMAALSCQQGQWTRPPSCACCSLSAARRGPICWGGGPSDMG